MRYVVRQRAARSVSAVWTFLAAAIELIEAIRSSRGIASPLVVTISVFAVVAGAAATALVLRWTESLERMTFFFCRSFYYLCCCYLRFLVQDARSFPIIHPPAGLSCGRSSGCASSGRVRIGEADEVTLTKATTTQQKLVAFDDVVIFAHLKRPNRPKRNPIEKEDLKDTNRLTSRVERQAGKQLATNMNKNEKSSGRKYCESPHAQREDCRNR